MRSMNLTDVSVKNLKRRRVRTALLVLSLVLAVSLLVGISSAVQSMQADLGKKMDEYGANVVVMPRMLESPVSYGGIAVGGAVPQYGDLDESDAVSIRTIPNKENINVVAPKLLGLVMVEGQPINAMGRVQRVAGLGIGGSPPPGLSLGAGLEFDQDREVARASDSRPEDRKVPRSLG